SAALGFVRARDLAGGRHKVVAVVGDGAMTGGLCYEALNDAGGTPSQLLVVLNDNEMSISRNVGALAAHLTRLRASRSWHGAKQAVKRGVERIPLVGAFLARGLDSAKTKLRHMMVPGAFFEAFGFRYLGPIDGHDLDSLTQILQSALEATVPTVLHVITQKGRGYTPAEDHPEKYHGVAPFFIEGGRNGSNLQSCAKVVGETLIQMADKDARVAAITAAMPTGTGLDLFQKAHPKRFFDVGIEEEHAATLSAGMA
ncbi:MAG TPA: 1-deoxy-D-xylulose-5-phosphate synthase N-terminal domain-containing protein, partial [Clostridia bacterium]|nr:1-deoxy-D-xylulose-5-phosphate synthase N-terminal domain-containing protein [Clostridia bacterium]